MTNPMRFLHLEDDPMDRELVLELLRAKWPDCLIVAVDTEETFVEALTANAFDLVLGDHSLPTFNGLKALTIVRERRPDLPFVFVSGTLGEDAAIESLKSGACDYVLKTRLTKLIPAIERALGVVEERNRHMKTEEEVRMLWTAVEQSPVSVLITDPEGRIEYVNSKFTQISGYTREELVGIKPSILKSGSTPSETYQALWETITAGREWRGEICNRRKDGTLYFESEVIAPIRGDEGHITHFLGIKEDVTERKTLEKQLFLAQKMEAIGTLAGSIAHDFNNILTAMIGYGTLLQRDIGNREKTLEYSGYLLGLADKAAVLTKGLLAFSRRQTLSPKPVDINHIIANVIKLIGRLIGENIRVESDLSPGALICLADSGQIEQVLMNLSTNARDAMPDGGRLSITTRPVVIEPGNLTPCTECAPGRYALITVADSGVGMDDQILARIFEPFFTTKEVGQGTGLGLSIIYGIIKQHRGQILVASHPGAGTIFSIYLPLSGEPTALGGALTARPVRGGTETILVAEDEPTVRNLIVDLLQGNGYRVIQAADGREAVEMFAADAGAISLTILDVVMPVKSGKEVFERICEIVPDVRVLFLSGYPMDMIEQRHLIPEGSPFLEKPIAPMELLMRIRDILDGKPPKGKQDGH
jgi:PAS domain S-box-containing protein